MIKLERVKRYSIVSRRWGIPMTISIVSRKLPRMERFVSVGFMVEVQNFSGIRMDGIRLVSLVCVKGFCGRPTDEFPFLSDRHRWFHIQRHRWSHTYRHTDRHQPVTRTNTTNPPQDFLKVYHFTQEGRRIENVKESWVLSCIIVPLYWILDDKFRSFVCTHSIRDDTSSYGDSITTIIRSYPNSNPSVI
jgi:hypothetical protein